MWDGLGLLSFISGSLLISSASSPSMYVSPYCVGGELNFCPVLSEFNWSPWFFVLGVLLVFLAYPVALAGSDKNLDEPLILNRTISGISFMLTGAVVTILGVELSGSPIHGKLPSELLFDRHIQPGLSPELDSDFLRSFSCSGRRLPSGIKTVQKDADAGNRPANNWLKRMIT